MSTTKDTHVTEVIFRKWNNKVGGTIALFPYDIVTNSGDINSYERIGQHGAADYQRVISKTTPAPSDESAYIALVKELEGLGYNLKIVKRLNPKKYLKAYKKMRGI